MCGVDQNVPAAATLLWNTEYGPRERGGSGPSRVAGYCDRRGIRAFSITGSSTWDWMKWAAETGRGAAIGAGSAHFQTLMGYDRQSGTWYVCNNNSPSRIDEYSEPPEMISNLAFWRSCSAVLARSRSTTLITVFDAMTNIGTSLELYARLSKLRGWPGSGPGQGANSRHHCCNEGQRSPSQPTIIESA
jgi:hypothetical protein